MSHNRADLVVVKPRLRVLVHELPDDLRKTHLALDQARATSHAARRCIDQARRENKQGAPTKEYAIGDEHEYLALRAEKSKWSDYNHELLKQMFTTDELANEYSFFGFATGSVNAGWRTRLDELRSDIDLSVGRLESIRERLELLPVARLRLS
jgi:hypothetical protein